MCCLNLQDEQEQYYRLRIPPHSVEAEQSVLGGLLLGGSFDLVADLLCDADFYRPEHKAIFRHIARLADTGKAIDIITASDVMQAAGDLDSVGGLAYLAEMASHAPGVINLRSYAEAVKERANLRRLILVGQEIATVGYDPAGRSSAELIDIAQTAVLALGDEGATEAQPVNVILKAVVDEIDMLYNSESDMTGLPTGFLDIDRRTGGLQNTDLIVVAGRPAMGKTTFVMNIVEHAILAAKKNALVFSLEMSSSQLMKRMIASVGRIPHNQIKTGKLRDESWDKLSLAISKLKDASLVIDDRAGMSVQQMRAIARKYHKRNPLSLVVVDYLQLATGDGKSDNRTEEVSCISRGLKAMAKELDCPVIALSQLNRSVEQRQDKRPRNADLRESGGIEQDADVIIMLYRDEVYDENSPHKGTAEACFTKFRNGEIGTDYLATRLDMCRFENLSHRPRPVE